jgi:hypothetical protein
MIQEEAKRKKSTRKEYGTLHLQGTNMLKKDGSCEYSEIFP